MSFRLSRVPVSRILIFGLASRIVWSPAPAKGREQTTRIDRTPRQTGPYLAAGLALLYSLMKSSVTLVLGEAKISTPACCAAPPSSTMTMPRA